MSIESASQDLLKVVTLLGAAVVMVPIFRRIGLGSVLGYLVAGLIIGPFGLKIFTESESILHIAELGVVMFLFVIGLEMRPAHLWSMRKDIFGLGTFQIAVCTILLTLLGVAYGLTLPVAFIGGMGFVLTSTAIVMQLLGERGDFALPRGQKMISILLFEDLLIVPLLAFVAFMAPVTAETAAGGSKLLSIGIGIGAIAAVTVAGIWLLNPLFRLLALAKAREVMTAAALLVVLGAALLMQVSGLSMAMGAFLAGVLLAESTFRHQIEADIEPFRGILLGLFFIGVGMSLNLTVVIANLPLIICGVLAMMATKAFCIYIVARFSGSSNSDAIDRAALMAQGGEFAFVLFAAAFHASIIDAETNANLTAIVILSMVLTPLVSIVVHKIAPKSQQSMDGVERVHEGLTGNVLIIGFGRFGQVFSQLMLTKNVDVTIIDTDADMIRSASTFGFKIYYGDGTRLDVLRASGAATAQAIAICVDNKDSALKMTELIKSEFPQAKILARAYDRTHARELVTAGVDFQIRETFESAIKFGVATLQELGFTEEEAKGVALEIRQRDLKRFQLELSAGATEAGRKLMLGNITKPAPLVEPQHDFQPINAEAKAMCKNLKGPEPT